MPSPPSSSPLPTGIQLMPLDPLYRKDPYPILAELRERDPIHHDTELQRFIFTRHDDVEAILRNPDYWSDPRKGVEGGFAKLFLGQGDEEPSMLLMDDPGHRRLRNLVNHPFTPRKVERWRGRAREVADRVIGQLDDGEFNLVESVANPIPTVVIAELLGIDPENHAQFKSWSDASIKVAFGPNNDPADIEAAEHAHEQLIKFFRFRIHLHAQPTAGLIHQVNGFVRQESFTDVTMRQGRR